MNEQEMIWGVSGKKTRLKQAKRKATENVHVFNESLERHARENANTKAYLREQVEENEKLKKEKKELEKESQELCAL